MDIQLLIMDVDGTLTDGKVYLTEDGKQLFKAFDIKDGYAIHEMLPENQIQTAIITGCRSPIVAKRAEMLSVNYIYQGITNKPSCIKALAERSGIAPENMAYIGDDLMDIESMMMCGVRGCPADAVDTVREISHFVSQKNGGNGAVREFIEWLIRCKASLIE